MSWLESVQSVFCIASYRLEYIVQFCSDIQTKDINDIHTYNRNITALNKEIEKSNDFLRWLGRIEWIIKTVFFFKNLSPQNQRVPPQPVAQAPVRQPPPPPPAAVRPIPIPPLVRPMPRPLYPQPPQAAARHPMEKIHRWLATPFNRKYDLAHPIHIDWACACELGKQWKLDPYILCNYGYPQDSLLKVRGDLGLWEALKRDRKIYTGKESPLAHLTEQGLIPQVQNSILSPHFLHFLRHLKQDIQRTHEHATKILKEKYQSDRNTFEEHYEDNTTLNLILTLQLGKIDMAQCYREGNIKKILFKKSINEINELLIKEALSLYKELEEVDKEIEKLGVVNLWYHLDLTRKRERKLKSIRMFVGTISRCKGLIFQDLRAILGKYFYYYVGDEDKNRILWLSYQDMFVQLNLGQMRVLNNIDQSFNTLELRRVGLDTHEAVRNAAGSLQVFIKDSLLKLSQNPLDPTVILPKYFHMTNTLEKFATLSAAGVAVECNLSEKKFQAGIFGSTKPEVQSYGSYGLMFDAVSFDFISNTPNVLSRRDSGATWVAFQKGLNGDKKQFKPFFYSQPLNKDKRKKALNLGTKDIGDGMILFGQLNAQFFDGIRPQLWELVGAWNAQDETYQDNFGSSYKRTEIEHAQYKRSLLGKDKFSSSISIRAITNCKKERVNQFNPSATEAFHFNQLLKN